MDPQTLHVVIGGEAGQGLVTVGELLAKGFVRSGYHVLVTQSYMSRIRGGHNSFSIRAGVAPISAPQEPIDVLVALDAATVRLHQAEVTQAGGVVLIDDSSAADVGRCVRVPFGKLAAPKYENMVALGVVAALMPDETRAGQIPGAPGGSPGVATESRVSPHSRQFARGL